MSIDKSVDISPLLTWNHFCSAIKLFFESCCNVVENGQFPPAGAQRARSRQSVTFAFGAHKVLDCLFDIGKWLRLESFFFFQKEQSMIVSFSFIYQSSCLVVVQHDLRFEVAASSVAGVHEFARLFITVLDIVSASAPLPVAVSRNALTQEEKKRIRMKSYF